MRRLEVTESNGSYSRLTITPERITVKVTPAHKGMTDAWVKAAKRIAERIDFDRSLRGRFSPETPAIWLTTDGSRSRNHRAFLYDFNGDLIREAV